MMSMDRSEPEDLADSGMPEMAGLPVRHAGRVIVLDPGGRVLLLRYDNDSPDGRHWATPGGGLNPGESYAAAASRLRRPAGAMLSCWVRSTGTCGRWSTVAGSSGSTSACSWPGLTRPAVS